MTTTVPQSQTQSESSPITRALARAYVLDWETIAYVAIFALAVFTRFYDLGTRVMSHDESLHTKFSWDLYKNGIFAHTPLMHGPLLFHMTAFSFFLFGDSDFTARIYPAVLGVGVVLIPLLFRRWIGRTAALLTSLLFLISPYLVYYSRYIRHDIPAIFFALAMIWAAFSYIEDAERRPRWLYLTAACMILLLASKEVAFIYIAVVGSFFTLLFAARFLQRRWPQVSGRLVFDALLSGVILGAIAAMGLIVVLTIIPRGSWDQPGYLPRVILWSALVVVPLLVLFFGVARGQFARRRFQGFPLGAVLAVILLATAVTLLFIVVEEVTRIEPTGEVAEPATPEQSVPGARVDFQQFVIQFGPLILVDALVILAGVGLAFLSRARGWWDNFTALPVFDPLILMGTLILPWLTAFVIKALGYSPVDYDNFWPMFFTFLPFAAISIIIGLAWNWRWGIAAGIFYGVYVFFFTTMFTNGRGLATGMIGSLGYWLEQQGVRRGNQPQYFYVLQTIFYEFLPLVGAMGAGLLGLNTFFRRLRQDAERCEAQAHTFTTQPPLPQGEGEAEEPVEAQPAPAAALPAGRLLAGVPVMAFFGYLAVASFIAYTLAGEKMPWLTTHITTPLIFLGGWYFARVLDSVDWQKFTQHGWTLLVLLPLAAVSGARVIGPMFNPAQRPFQGLAQSQLSLTGEWLAALLVFIGVIAAIVAIIDYVGIRHLGRVALVAGFLVLCVTTIRSAWLASFINYDLATEYLVYAHAAPAVKTVLDRIEEISLRTTDGLGVVLAYDNETSWPNSWYFRNFTNARFFGASPSVQILDEARVVVVGVANRGRVEPLLQDRYYRFDYIRLWWPMQDYFNMTMARIDKLFSPEYEGAQLRQGLWDIWWSRDYSTYARATGRDPSVFSVSNWPVSDRMSFFVRKDVAAQVWSYGVGETAQIDVHMEDPYAVNAVVLAAAQAFGSEAQLNAPRGMDLDEEGNLYVADSRNHRIAVFGPEGEFLFEFGQRDEMASEGVPARPGYFNEPWGVAVAADGTIFVADTWNHRVQAFTPEGEFITTWGRFGTDNAPDALYGPRNVVVRGQELYLVDTGNKRIRVYDFEGSLLRDIGSGGLAPGELNEPVGLAVDDDGNLIVADTWNRRVEVFERGGDYLTDWRVNAWYGLAGEFRSGNLPFLTIDDRGNIYVPDPDTCRIIVFDKHGEYRYNFGRCNPDAPTSLMDFGSLGGLAMNDKYQLYIADPQANRILRFDLAQEPPLQPIPPAGEGGG